MVISISPEQLFVAAFSLLLGYSSRVTTPPCPPIPACPACPALSCSSILWTPALLLSVITLIVGIVGGRIWAQRRLVALHGRNRPFGTSFGSANSWHPKSIRGRVVRLVLATTQFQFNGTRCF